MSRITKDLLQKRAEHNEGMLSTLEEISLHQQDLVKIENFDILCRHLKILYLQNNIIEKLENLNKLKQLEYLNMALNNISVIENIQGCQSLRKLDFTVNFIDGADLQKSVQCLAKLPNLKQIYLTGNPCEDWTGCKDYIIAKVPLLETYNGTVILPSERIKAIQQIKNLEQDLYRFIQMRKIEKKKKELDEQQERIKRQKNGEKPDETSYYTKQVRRKMYEDIAKDKEKKEKERFPQKFEVKKQSAMFNQQGQIRQCNEGRYQYELFEHDDPDYSFFHLKVPMFMQTSQLITNIDPKWVSVRIKDKLIQIRLMQEIIVSQSTVQRSIVTGILTIKMKKVTSQPFIKSKTSKPFMKLREKIKLEKQQQRHRKNQLEKEKQQQQSKARLRLCDQYERRKEQQDDDVPDLQ